MSDPALLEHANVLEVRSPMPAGMRVLLAALGFIPLAAPYELLIEIEWEHFTSPFFFLAASVSAGALAVSALLFFAGAAGLSSSMVFDKRTETFTHSAQAPIVRRTRRSRPLADIRGIEVGVREWGDGPPTYYLGVTVKDGAVFESGSSSSRAEMETIRSRVEEFLGS